MSDQSNKAFSSAGSQPGLPEVMLDDGVEQLDTDRILTEALHSIRRHLGMEIAFISEFVGDHRIFRHVDSAEAPAIIPQGSSLPLKEGYCQRVVDGRLPELICNAQELPAALEIPATLAIPIGAHISVPIRFRDGRLYGTFCCFSRRPDPSLNERDLAMMRVFADFTARQLEREALSRRELQEAVTRIRSVLDGGSFSIVYQPIVLLDENKIIGYEALSRFSATPIRSPDKWFEEAGRVGLQVALEVAALHKALEVFDDLPGDAYLSLNVSPATLMSGAIGPILESRSPDRIVLEVTEHVSITDYVRFNEVLAPLRDYGVALAVDDAGAGYASFRHILKLKPDIIKLDMSLTRHIDTDPGCYALAVALIQFAADMGSKIIAEGVETQGELDALRRLRVDNAQGYFLGRPMPFDRSLPNRQGRH